MHLRLEQPMNAPADLVWRTLGMEFAEIDRWSTFVRTSRPIDRSEVPIDSHVAPSAPVPGRETRTRAKLIEVITAYSDTDRSLTFAGVGLPRVVRRATDTQTVHTDGPHRCIVSFEIDFDLVGPLRVFDPIIRRRMTRQFTEVLDDLRRHTEAEYTQAAR
ncbi:MAG: SRPBCC family protein [Actinomycetota bacterium]